MSQELEIIEINPRSKLQFCHIEINPEYRKKWNIHENDFICLARNGELIRDTLYRIGGISQPRSGYDYLLLLKYIESNTYLKGIWCLLDLDGNEIKEFDQFHCPSLIKNSLIYSLGQKYYNIKTGEFYCHAYNYLESADFLFLSNDYDENKTKRGVMKINKKDGTWELFKLNND